MGLLISKNQQNLYILKITLSDEYEIATVDGSYRPQP